MSAIISPSSKYRVTFPDGRSSSIPISCKNLSSSINLEKIAAFPNSFLSEVKKRSAMKIEERAA